VHPGMGGWDFLRLIKSDAALKHIPVIMISAAPISSQAKRVKQRRLNPERDLATYLQRPISAEQLVEAIEDARTLLASNKPLGASPA
jgi:CheY-like chemotaxis protein